MNSKTVDKWVARSRRELSDEPDPKAGEGWLHLATVIDLCTRTVVGWSLSDRMTADIAVAALESAKSRGYVAGSAIFRSDRGAQYASRTLAEWARANDVRLSCSLGRRSDSYTLKKSPNVISMVQPALAMNSSSQACASSAVANPRLHLCTSLPNLSLHLNCASQVPFLASFTLISSLPSA